MIRVWIIDDEKAARDRLKLALAPHQITIVAEFSALSQLPQLLPDDIDAIFLDINMPGALGIEIKNLWQNCPHLIFVTAHHEYAVKAFEIAAVDYILKPFDQTRIDEAIRKINENIDAYQSIQNRESVKKLLVELKKQTSARAISLKTDEGLVRVKLSDIFYLESVKDFVAVHTEKKSLLVRTSLNELLVAIEHAHVVRCHRSYAVNKDKITYIKKLRFGDAEIVLSSGQTLRLSRRFKTEFDNF